MLCKHGQTLPLAFASGVHLCVTWITIKWTNISQNVILKRKWQIWYKNNICSNNFISLTIIQSTWHSWFNIWLVHITTLLIADCKTEYGPLYCHKKIKTNFNYNSLIKFQNMYNTFLFILFSPFYTFCLVHSMVITTMSLSQVSRGHRHKLNSFNSLFQSSILAHIHGTIIPLIHCPSPGSNQVLGTSLHVWSPFVPAEPLPPL